MKELQEKKKSRATSRLLWTTWPLSPNRTRGSADLTALPSLEAPPPPPPPPPPLPGLAAVPLHQELLLLHLRPHPLPHLPRSRELGCNPVEEHSKHVHAQLCRPLCHAHLVHRLPLPHPSSVIDHIFFRCR